MSRKIVEKGCTKNLFAAIHDVYIKNIEME